MCAICAVSLRPGGTASHAKMDPIQCLADFFGILDIRVAFRASLVPGRLFHSTLGAFD
jgi:hypothetical protein